MPSPTISYASIRFAPETMSDGSSMAMTRVPSSRYTVPTPAIVPLSATAIHWPGSTPLIPPSKSAGMGVSNLTSSYSSAS